MVDDRFIEWGTAGPCAGDINNQEWLPISMFVIYNIYMDMRVAGTR